VAKLTTLFLLSLKVVDARFENRLHHLDLFGDGVRGKRSKTTPTDRFSLRVSQFRQSSRGTEEQIHLMHHQPENRKGAMITVDGKQR
jgi:hypothetical protein